MRRSIVRRGSDDRRTDRVKKPERKRIARLKIEDGKTIDEIAEQLGRDKRTIKKALEAVADPAPVPGHFPEWKKKHWDDLAKAAGDLAENLWILLLQDDRGQALYEIKGDVVEGGIAEMDYVMEGMWGDIFDSRRQLRKVDRLLASGLISHLGIPVKKWNELTAMTVSREIMHELELAARRRTFEGICEICAGWSR